jgi:hypothetical protein
MEFKGSIESIVDDFIQVAFFYYLNIKSIRFVKEKWPFATQRVIEEWLRVVRLRKLFCDSNTSFQKITICFFNNVPMSSLEM